MWQEFRGVIIVGISALCSISVCGVVKYNNDTQIAIVRNCKVIELQQQTVCGTDGNVATTIRYLVVTDKETFICETSALNSKFNNSDIFYRLRADSTYTFKVCGYGKSLFFDYRNILEVQ